MRRHLVVIICMLVPLGPAAAEDEPAPAPQSAPFDAKVDQVTQQVLQAHQKGDAAALRVLAGLRSSA